MWISRHRRILGNEEADNLAKEGTSKLPVDQTAVIPFVVGKEVSRSHLRQQYLNRWKAYNGYCHSKVLMSKHLPRRAEEFQAMSRMKIKVGVVLLTGFTTPTAHVFNLRLTQRQDCWLCRDKKEGSKLIVCHGPSLAYKWYRTLGCTLLKPKDLENMRVKRLISQVVTEGLV